MNMPFKVLFAIAAAGIVGLSGSCFAAKMDAVVGNWKLNVSKSKFDPAPAMQKFESTVTVTQDGQYAYKTDWTEGDGTPGHLEFTTSFGWQIRPRDRVRCGRQRQGHEGE